MAEHTHICASKKKSKLMQHNMLKQCAKRLIIFYKLSRRTSDVFMLICVVTIVQFPLEEVEAHSALLVATEFNSDKLHFFHIVLFSLSL